MTSLRKWGIALLAVLPLLACQRERVDLVNPVSGKSGETQLTFTATMEGGADIRTVLSGTRVMWNPTESINIFYGPSESGSRFVSTNTEPALSASFSGTISAFTATTETGQALSFWAVYPYNESDSCSGTSVSSSLPSEQTGVSGNIPDNAMMMVAESPGLALSFKQVCSRLRLKISHPDICRIVFSGNAGEAVAGGAEISLDGSGNPVWTPIEGKEAREIELVPDGTYFEQGSEYYLVLYPQNFVDGVTIKYYRDELYGEIDLDEALEFPRAGRNTFDSDEVTKWRHVAGGFEYVDLGLSVKWGTYNLGATQSAESGDYYQWAGIQTVTSTKVNEDNCPYHTGFSTTTQWTKYIPTEMASYWSGTGDPDNILALDDVDEVVHRTMGGKWRMPTVEEFQELKDNCTMQWTSNYESTGVKGLIFTSNKPGYTDQSIFLPAAGYRYDISNRNVNYQGYYWSSSLNATSPEKARIFGFRSDWKNVSSGDRYYGYTIRPVYDENYHEHSIVLVPGQSPTETTPGWIECYKCSTCDKYFEDELGYVPIGDEAAYLAWKSNGGAGYLELPHAVDLGLSVKWASCNVGAKNAYTPGNYFAWGETEEKEYYNSSTYLFGYQLSKYCVDIAYGDVDNKIVLEKEDDAAYANWGGNWRMPTSEEIAELIDNCSWTQYEAGNTEFNGVPGYKAQSLKPGYTDNYIFLPCAGYRYEDRVEGASSSSSYYWSSSLYPWQRFYAQGLGVSGTLGMTLSRYYGYPIRPVNSDNPNGGITGISLDKTVLSICVDDTEALTGTVTKNAGAINDLIEWSSSDPSVATVDYTGCVTGVAVGTATITAKTVFGGFTATCNTTVNASPEHEFVDLGLSVKWATCNLGANRPYDYGKYYSWGEIKAFGEEDSSNPNVVGIKRDYSSSTYKFYLGSTISKYETVSTYDSPTILEPEDDAAYVNWGADWRMPTFDEMKELEDNCTFTWFDRGNTEFNGVRGYKVQSQIEGYTDKFIFFPFPGYRSEYSVNERNTYGIYWTSTLAYDYANRGLWFSFNGPNTANFSKIAYRYYGASIRPVRE